MANYQTKVYRKQGGNEMVVASGGTLTLEAGAVMSGLGLAGVLPGNLAQGTIPLGQHLFAARQLASAETLSTGVTAIITASADSPQLALTSSGDQSLYLNYASAVVSGIKLPPVAMPADIATAGGLTIELFGECVGTATAADAAMGFDVRCWSGIGDTEMGATHPNFTSTPSWKGITVASGDLNATANLNITLVPSAHAGRALRLYDMRARYTRSS